MLAFCLDLAHQLVVAPCISPFTLATVKKYDWETDTYHVVFEGGMDYDTHLGAKYIRVRKDVKYPQFGIGDRVRVKQVHNGAEWEYDEGVVMKRTE